MTPFPDLFDQDLQRTGSSELTTWSGQYN